MQEKGFYFVDGSYLFQIFNDLRNKNPEYASKKVDLDQLTQSIMSFWRENTQVGMRVTYYFRKGDPRIKELLKIDHSGNNHFQIIECGEKTQSIPKTIVDKIPEKWRDNLSRSEKGVDMELACDALIIAFNKAMNCMILFAADRDFIPLFRTLQKLGVNTYLSTFGEKNPPDALLNIADRHQNARQLLIDSIV